MQIPEISFNVKPENLSSLAISISGLKRRKLCSNVYFIPSKAFDTSFNYMRVYKKSVNNSGLHTSLILQLISIKMLWN